MMTMCVAPARPVTPSRDPERRLARRFTALAPLTPASCSKTTASRAVPCAMGGSHAARAASLSEPMIASGAITQAAANGPGVAKYPSASAASAASNKPRPAPPKRSGTSTPASPSSTSPPQSCSSNPDPDFASRCSASIGRRSPRYVRTSRSNSRCVSLGPNSMASPPPRRLRLPRETEAALGDDVLLDLRRPPADHETDVVHVVDLPRRRLVVLGRLATGLVDEAGNTEHVHGERRQPVPERRAEVLHEELFHAGVLTAGALRQEPQVMPSGRHDLGLQPEQTVAELGHVDDPHAVHRRSCH